MSEPTTNLPALPASVSAMPVLLLEPSVVAEVISENLQGIQASMNDLDKIKVPGADSAMFTVQTLDGPKGMSTIEGIVCMVSMSRAFWMSDDGGNTPPDCCSDNLIHGLGRRGNNDDHDGPHDCASCPMNQFGSAMKDGKPQAGKACGERAHIAFLMGEGFLPNVVQVPSTSLAAWRKYLVRLSSFGKKYTAVVTSIGLVPKKSRGGKGYCELTFASAGSLPPLAIERVSAYAKLLEASFKRIVREEQGMPGGDAADAPPPFAEEFPGGEYEEGSNG